MGDFIPQTPGLAERRESQGATLAARRCEFPGSVQRPLLRFALRGRFDLRIVSGLFAQEGEAGFRDWETRALREIAAKLKTGQADLCISQGRIEDKELSGLRLHTFELGLLVSKNSPLAACESVQLSELKDHEFASFLAGSGHRRNVELMCNQAGWSPKVTLETNHYADIVRAVATGRYVATVVRNIYENYGNGDVRFVRIEGADTRVEVWLHWDSSERLNPLAHKLKKIFREGVVSCDTAMNLIVLKTLPGLASAASSALDGMDIQDLVGTVAGDDTVFIAMRDPKTAEQFCEEIRKLF